MPPTPSLVPLALSHLIPLRPPPGLLRRDTPARVAPANGDPGAVKSKAVGNCPSHVLADTFGPTRAERDNAGYFHTTSLLSRDVTNPEQNNADFYAIVAPPAEGETEQDRAAAEGWEPEGWTEADPYDLLNEPEVWFCPDCGTEERPGKGGWNCATCDRRLIRDDARVEEAPPCARCCGTGQEIAAATGELDSCGDCGGTGLAEPWRDPDYAAHYGICPGCGISTHPTPEAGSCPTCDARLLAALYAEAWGDDPDPGDGGLGLGSWAASVEAELGCPSCGRPTPHLWAGATCAGCLVAGRAA